MVPHLNVVAIHNTSVSLSTELAPKPLYLHLDVAIYYLFLQLYALFPCNFFTFLRGRYGPTGERRYFQQYIAVSLRYCFVLRDIGLLYSPSSMAVCSCPILSVKINQIVFRDIVPSVPVNCSIFCACRVQHASI